MSTEQKPMDPEETGLRVLHRQLEYGAHDFSRRPISDELRASLNTATPCTDYMIKEYGPKKDELSDEEPEDDLKESHAFVNNPCRYQNLYTQEKIQRRVKRSEDKAKKAEAKAKKVAEAKAKKAAEALGEEDSQYGRWVRTPTIAPCIDHLAKVAEHYGQLIEQKYHGSSTVTNELHFDVKNSNLHDTLKQRIEELMNV